MKKFLIFSTLATLCATGHANYYESGCCEYGSFELGADLLYWKTYQDNLEYGAFVVPSGGGTNISSSVISPEFDMNSGFRVFAGFKPNECPWQFEIIFSRITSQTFNSMGADPSLASSFIVLNNANFPVFNLVNSTIMNLAYIDSSWDSQVNILDLDLCRTSCCYGSFEISPHMGLRGMWLRETLLLEGASPLGSFFSSFEEKYDGYGLEGGLHAHLPLCFGISLNGHIGGSLLYARISVEEDVDILVAPTTMGMLTVNNQIHHLSPTIDGYIGLGYYNIFFQCPVNLHIGWEQHILINSNHFSVFSYSDMTLQGLTFGGSIAF